MAIDLDGAGTMYGYCSAGSCSQDVGTISIWTAPDFAPGDNTGPRCWVDTQNNHVTVSKCSGGGNQVLFDGDGWSRCFGCSGAWTSGQWTSIVVTYNKTGPACSFYINGNSMSTQWSSGTWGATTIGNLLVGAARFGGSYYNYMDGDVAELACYDVELSSGDIALLAAANSALLVNPSHLLGYWKFTTASGARDAGSNDFTLVGSPPASTHPTINYTAASSLVTRKLLLGVGM